MGGVACRMANSNHRQQHAHHYKEMKMDRMNITILDDGTIKVETDKISQANRMTAEAFMRNIASACGGRQEQKHKHGVLGHAHHHTLGAGH